MNILCGLAILRVYPDSTDNNLICSTVRPYGKVIPPVRLLNNRTNVPSCYNSVPSHKATVIFANAGMRKSCVECFLLMEFTKKERKRERKKLCVLVVNP